MNISINKRGFTLVELLIVIAILAVLSVVGMAVFSNISKGARDTRRKADIDAIAKVYEIQKTSGYIQLQDSYFASGVKPKDPDSNKGDYFNWLASDGSGYKVCASLDNNPSSACNTPAQNCYCKFSIQATVNPSSSADSTSSYSQLGLGGSTQSSCDTNGTLLSGLAGYWKFDEGTGIVVANSAGGSNGTWYGAGSHWTTGKFGSAGDFNSIDDYVSIPISFSSSYTISLWVNSGGNSSTAMIWEGQDNSAPSLEGTDNGYSFYMKDNMNIYMSLNTGALTTGIWYHIAAAYDGSSQKLYVNATPKGSNSVGVSGDSVSVFYLGARDTPELYWKGYIDDVRIYNRALSQTEIQTLWNNDNGCIS